MSGEKVRLVDCPACDGSGEDYGRHKCGGCGGDGFRVEAA